MKGRQILAMFVSVLAVIGVVSLLGYAIYDEFKHPCLEYRQDTCSRSVCILYQNPGDITSMCMVWQTEDYPCQTCVRRKP